jgi:hypothetical protein
MNTTQFLMICLSLGLNLIFIFVWAELSLKKKALQNNLKSSQHDFLVAFQAYLRELSKDKTFESIRAPYTRDIQIISKNDPEKLLAVFRLEETGLEMEFFSDSFPSFKTMVPFGDGESAGFYVLDRLCYPRSPIMTGTR